MTLSRLWLIVFLIGLLTQSFLWQRVTLVDRSMWEKHIQDIFELNADMFNRGVYGHPGTLLAVVAIGGHIVFDASYHAALIGSMSVLIAVAVACATTLAYRLRPQSAWWLVVPFVLYGNYLYLMATPPTAVVCSWLALIVLLSWWLWEQGSAITMKWLFAWSVAVGLAAAVRTDITGITAVPLLLLVATRVGWPRPGRGWRSVAVMGGLAFVTFCLVNPFMWFMPLRHVQDLLHIALFHYTEYGVTPSPLAWSSFLAISPLSWVSIGLALTFIFIPSLPSPLPRFFLAGLLLICALVSILLLNSRLQTPRYFFPYAFIWEMLLPLFVLTLLQQLHSRRAHNLMLAFFIVLPLGLLLHFSTLPEVTIFCLPPRAAGGTWCHSYEPG